METSDILPVNRGEDHIIEPPCSHRICSVLSLHGVERGRRSGSFHRAESGRENHQLTRFLDEKSRPATSCASVSHQHDSGSCCAFLTTPALTNVRTPEHVRRVKKFKIGTNLASSQTVANFKPLRSPFSFEKFFPMGISVLSQGGNLNLLSPVQRVVNGDILLIEFPHLSLVSACHYSHPRPPLVQLQQ